MTGVDWVCKKSSPGLLSQYGHALMRWHILILGLTWNHFVWAQAPTFRLTDLLQKALTSHPTIYQARDQVSAAGHELDAAKWGRFPALTSELRSDNQYTQSVAKLEQPLWAGGRIDGRIDLVQSNVQVAEAGVREAELTALNQVGFAFFELVRLRARQVAASANVQEHQRLLDLITRPAEAQISPEADVTLANARWQQARSEQLQISRQFESTRHNLSQWVGPLEGQPLAPRALAYSRSPMPEATVIAAQSFSPLRQKLLSQITSAQAQIDLAKAQSLPTVVAGYQHVVSGPLFLSPDRGRAYIGLQYQPGAGLSSLAGLRSAVSRKDAAERELQTHDMNLQAQVMTLYHEIDNLNEQISPALALELATADLMESTLRQYQIGRKNWLDVLNSQREKTQAAYNLADVQSSLLQSQLKLMLLTQDVQTDKASLIHE